jgi:hypothetical protein
VSDETETLRNRAGSPEVVHRGAASIEGLLQYIDPALDEETERFVAVIYADRREAAGLSSPQ